MPDTLADRVAKLAARGKTAIQIHQQFRDEGYNVPWLSILAAFQAWQKQKQAGGK